MEDLANNMNDLAKRYGKELMIAEVSMGYTMEDYAAYEKLAPHERKGMATKPELAAKVPYSMTKEGQKQFLLDLFEIMKQVPDKKVRGYFYWEAPCRTALRGRSCYLPDLPSFHARKDNKTSL